MLKKILLMVVVIVFFTAPVFGSGSRVPEWRTDAYQTFLLQAINKALSLDKDGADALLRQAVGMDPDHPMAYALQAMLHMFAYEMSYSDEFRKKEKEGLCYYTEEAVRRAEKKVAGYPEDVQARLAMALAKISRVHWAVKAKKYWMAAKETASIWNCLEATRRANPRNHDVDFLMGMLHYQLDQLRGLTGFVTSLLITEGDRLKGLEEMQRAAQKGILLREAAQIQLASIYLFYERQPAKALSFIQPLRRQYPDNYNFHFLEGMMMADLGRIAEARSIAADIEKKMKAGKPVYPPELQPRYDHLMGRIHFRQAEYETAESYFHKVMQNKAVYNMRTAARAELGIGMIHDVRQERRQAEERYRRAMKTEGADGSTQLDCAKYLKTPYRPNG